MKKTRIDIRGIIVPSEYDASYFASYIERGIFTPESRVRKALAEAKGDVDIYINSPGGSVIAGNEIINAIEQARADGKSVSITIGAWAASMGANIALASPRESVSAHKNSKLMFHGASAITLGGEQAHRDEATLLAKMNADWKSELVRRGNDEATVAEWFEEGREGCLSADEALAANIVGTIVNANDEEPAAVLKMADIDDLAAHKLQIAACAAIQIEAEADTEEAEPETTEATETPEATETEEAEAKTEEDPDEETPEALKLKMLSAMQEAETVRAELKAMQAAKDREIAAVHKAHKEAIEKHAAEMAARAEYIKNLETEKQATDARLARLTSAGLALSAEPQSWQEALKLTNGDHAQAVKLFPELHRQVINRGK